MGCIIVACMQRIDVLEPHGEIVLDPKTDKFTLVTPEAALREALVTAESKLLTMPTESGTSDWEYQSGVVEGIQRCLQILAGRPM